MPIHEYVCQSCGRKTEVIQLVGEGKLKICPHCGGRLKKAFSAPAIQFKGTGWYVTDYARAKPDDKSRKSKSEPGEKSEKVGKVGQRGQARKEESRKEGRRLIGAPPKVVPPSLSRVGAPSSTLEKHRRAPRASARARPWP